MEYLRNGVDEDGHLADIYAAALIRNHEELTQERANEWLRLGMFNAAETLLIFERYKELLDEQREE